MIDFHGSLIYISLKFYIENVRHDAMLRLPQASSRRPRAWPVCSRPRWPASPWTCRATRWWPSTCARPPSPPRPPPTLWPYSSGGGRARSLFMTDFIMRFSLYIYLSVYLFKYKNIFRYVINMSYFIFLPITLIHLKQSIVVHDSTEAEGCKSKVLSAVQNTRC